MSHTALARKHRPTRFAEVSTQEHVSDTLRRAVATDRVGHAYLFCGPRGVGKTTLARVLAMALNCSHREDDGEPCGECEDCRRIWSGTTSLDVVEIDAASNRGVDDARRLRERAQYSPSEDDRFKVYIVDEAHMLTREAWNALLKVLEEPPPRVVFIFATTEPQKIEQTAAPIMSRCQRFDFRRIGVAEIVDRIREVLAAEGTTASDEALRLIARKADGGMRDALSLTDQLLALSEDGIRSETVRRILGIVEEERYLELFDHLTGRDRRAIFGLVEELVDQGYDLVEFYHGLLEALRTLLRLRVGGDDADLPEERRADWAVRAEHFAAADLVRMLGMAAELETSGSLRRTNQPRILLELLLLRFSWLDRTVAVEKLIEALGGDGPIPALSPPSTPSAPSRGTKSDARGRGSTGPTGSEKARMPRTSPEDQDSAGSENAADAGTSADDAAPAPTGGLPPIEAWNAVLEAGEAIPPGLTPFLLAARVETHEDVVVLHVPEGPGEERLRTSGIRQALQAELRRHGSGTLELRVEVGALDSGPARDRVSRSEVRQGQLDDLLSQEPGLKPAVEELDLEVAD